MDINEKDRLPVLEDIKFNHGSTCYENKPEDDENDEKLYDITDRKEF